jgi:phosphatidylserine/phosphatidylglycerophosphate/cardiolipin synthase-like enzyme
MTKKSSRRSSSKSQSSERRPSIIGTILAGIVLVIALILSSVTGIDFVDLLGLGGTATDAPVITVTTAPGTPVANLPGDVLPISVGQGFGAQKGFWQVFFTAPTGSSDRNSYVNGIDGPLAAAINGAQRTIDMAAFEFNNPVLTQAMVAAAERGVVVRMVTDTEHGLEDEDSTIQQLIDAGVEIVDDGRSAFMHNKFTIIDSLIVWTGSMNYTVNDVYRNNNNLISLRSRRAVETYQAEFDEMFVNRQFGPRSPARNTAIYNQDGIPIQITFAPENNVLLAITNAVSAAQSSVRFMAFSFTEDSIAQSVLDRAGAGVSVQGIFERTGSETEFSELRPMFCAGIPVRQDGNRYVLHHKVFIIDNTTVLAGSFNFSANATSSNDENLLFIQDPALAAQYNAEFERRWAEATVPSNLTC